MKNNCLSKQGKSPSDGHGHPSWPAGAARRTVSPLAEAAWKRRTVDILSQSCNGVRLAEHFWLFRPNVLLSFFGCFGLLESSVGCFGQSYSSLGCFGLASSGNPHDQLAVSAWLISENPTDQLAVAAYSYSVGCSEPILMITWLLRPILLINRPILPLSSAMGCVFAGCFRPCLKVPGCFRAQWLVRPGHHLRILYVGTHC